MPGDGAAEAGLRAALLSPPGHGGIAVLGLSGRGARELAEARLFKPDGTPANVRPGRLAYGVFRGADGSDLDEVLVGCASPGYVEINCHGGPLPARRILESLERAGAELVEARHFLGPSADRRDPTRGREDTAAGRLPAAGTRLELEAHEGLFSASTELAARVLAAQAGGALGRELRDISALLAACGGASTPERPPGGNAGRGAAAGEPPQPEGGTGTAGADRERAAAGPGAAGGDLCEDSPTRRATRWTGPEGRKDAESKVGAAPAGEKGGTDLEPQRGAAGAAGRLESLLETAPLGLALADPPLVAVVGPANAGKSSLVNALAGYERNIVTHVAGTTRDAVRVPAALCGVGVVLVDTAGRVPVRSRLEAESSRSAAAAFEESAAAVLVVDVSAPLPPDVAPESAGRPLLVAANKCDLEADAGTAEALGGWSCDVLETSATEGTGLAELSERILAALGIPPPNDAATRPVVFTRRQQRHIEEALASLRRRDVAGARDEIARCIWGAPEA